MRHEVKLLIVGDSEIILQGIKTIVEKDPLLVPVGYACALSKMPNLQEDPIPDVLLLCICDDNSGEAFDLVRKILEKNSRVRIVILLNTSSRVVLNQAILAGVNGLLGKDTTPAELIQAVHHVSSSSSLLLGNTLPIEEIMNTFLSVKHINEIKPYGLTAKELDVLSLLVKGYVTKMIADKLSLSCHTVETYKERIKSKLGVGTIVEAAVIAVRNGLLVLSFELLL